MAVLRRDDWTCQLPTCGRKGGRFEVHHIQPVYKGGGDQLGNLITYCRDCHFDVHRPTRTLVQTEWDAYIDKLAKG